jgi:hypothetical protein
MNAGFANNKGWKGGGKAFMQKLPGEAKKSKKPT